MTSSFTTIDERSPFAVKQRMRRKSNYGEEPAITVLSPDPKMTVNNLDFFRSPSTGNYRTAPTKSANTKNASSFVILGEMLNTPVQSRPASPSGRVSPFRGHSFKSPAVSRGASPSRGDQSKRNDNSSKAPASKKPSVSAKGPKNMKDIGLPPKSPKRLGLQPVNSKSAVVRKTHLGSEPKTKPSKTPRPGRKQLNVANIKHPSAGKSSKPFLPADQPGSVKGGDENEIVPLPARNETDMREVSEALQNWSDQQAGDGEFEAAGKMELDALRNNHVAGESGNDSNLPKIIDVVEKSDDVEETEMHAVKEQNFHVKNEESVTVGKTSDSSSKESHKDKIDDRNAGDSAADNRDGDAGKSSKNVFGTKESENSISCLQPDKCHIAPPTMASPSPIVASAINAPATASGPALTKTTESIATSQATVTTTTLNGLSAAVTISGNLAKKSHENRERAIAVSDPSEKPVGIEKKKTRTSIDSNENLYKRNESESDKTWNLSKVSASTPPNPRPAARGTLRTEQTEEPTDGDVISTSNLIKVDSELELLSANSLRDSPPRRQPNPAWNEERLVNGDVPPGNETNRGKFRRFLSSTWQIIKYLFCCRCIFHCCRRLTCCKIDVDNGPRRSRSSNCCPGFRNRLNCLNSSGRSNCCKCRKVKCCEDAKCCKKKQKASESKRNCCAKVNCSCRDCCVKMKHCCFNCGNKLNNFCRALFCLNLVCCQKCLRRCCKSCHGMKCCQKGGCCSCFNPNVKREANRKGIPKLDKRSSSQSKSEKENLDPVLVEHVSMMKAAIPVLPTGLAILCLMLNLILPGTGTLMSGLFCLCFGKPRFSIQDTAKNRLGSFCVNLIIGIAQLFTIIFCLVGWGWSIWWGVIMYRLARKQKRIKLAEKSAKEANDAAIQNHVDAEKG